MNSILGPEVEINGDVDIRGSIMIYGRITGNVTAKGTIRTAQGSLIRGNIIAKEALISGTVEGDIQSEGKVTLGEKAVLQGSLRSNILVVEGGAQFDGSCRMSEPKPSTPIRPVPEGKPNI